MNLKNLPLRNYKLKQKPPTIPKKQYLTKITMMQ